MRDTAAASGGRASGVFARWDSRERVPTLQPNSVAELVRVCAAVDLLQPLDLVDVRARLRELDALTRRAPLVDVLLPRVVGSKREPLVGVFRHQVMQVPRAVADVDLR